jgi:hypothetical protein
MVVAIVSVWNVDTDVVLLDVRRFPPILKDNPRLHYRMRLVRVSEKRNAGRDVARAMGRCRDVLSAATP